MKVRWSAAGIVSESGSRVLLGGRAKKMFESISTGRQCLHLHTPWPANNSSQAPWLYHDSCPRSCSFEAGCCDRAGQATMHPLCVMSISTIMHDAQNPAQSSMLRVCMREKSFPGRNRPLARAASRRKLTFTNAATGALGCRLYPSILPSRAGGCLHELVAGPWAAIVLLQGALKAQWGPPKLLVQCRTLLQWPHRAINHSVSSLLMPQQTTACASTHVDRAGTQAAGCVQRRSGTFAAPAASVGCTVAGSSRVSFSPPHVRACQLAQYGQKKTWCTDSRGSIYRYAPAMSVVVSKAAMLLLSLQSEGRKAEQLCGQAGVLPEPVPAVQAVPGPQNPVLRRGPLPVLCAVRAR